MTYEILNLCGQGLFLKFDGFRLIYPMLQDQGWEAVMEFLGKNSQPMKEYVREHIHEMLDSETAEFIRKNKLRPKLKFGKIPKH